MNIITTKQKAIRMIEEALKCLQNLEYTEHGDCIDDLRTAADYLEEAQA